MPKPRGSRQGSSPAAGAVLNEPAEKPTRSTLGPAATLVGAGGIFKSAAIEVLRIERRLMTTGEITKIALQRGFLKAQGKTPEATMASALYTDVKKRNGTSIFTRPQEGLFGLREWIDEGFFPEGFWAGGGPQLEFADSGIPVAVSATYRRRHNVTQHRVTQRGPDGQIITTVSGIPPTSSCEDATAAAAAAMAAALPMAATVLPLPAGLSTINSAPVDSSGASGAVAAAAGRIVVARSTAAPRASARANFSGAKASGNASGTANSDEDGSDHYPCAGDMSEGAEGEEVGGEGAGGSRSGGGAATSAPTDLLLLLGEAALADDGGSRGSGKGGAARGQSRKRPVREPSAEDDADLAGQDASAIGAAGATSAPSLVAPAVASRTGGLDRLLALHEAATGPQKGAGDKHSGDGAAEGDGQQQPKRQQLSGGGLEDQGAPKGLGGAHVQQQHAQQQQQAAMELQMMQQMQWQQYMGMGQWPGNMYSPMYGGYYDPSGLMSQAGTWDASAACANLGAASGGGDLLHHMSVSLGLPPPAPLPPMAAAGPLTSAPSATRCGDGAKRRPRGSGTASGDTDALAPPTPKTLQDVAHVDDWQAAIESAEKALGRDHPAIGRAWLDLARALQSAGAYADRARLALKRALDVMMAVNKNGTVGDSFTYLLGKIKEQGVQQAQHVAEAVAAAAAAAAAAAEQRVLPAAAAADAVGGERLAAAPAEEQQQQQQASPMQQDREGAQDGQQVVGEWQLPVAEQQQVVSGGLGRLMMMAAEAPAGPEVMVPMMVDA